MRRWWTGTGTGTGAGTGTGTGTGTGSGSGSGSGSEAGTDPEDAVAVPITDELDLHHFQPREIGSLVPEYLEAAQAAGFARVRVVHGKGTGVLRERVHAILRRHPAVASFALADERRGGWGATVVELRPRG
ncbi:MAG: Smr/MutS family protein [Kofleriaceae bacterium]|nr:Smr/MutS family protein [Kofleriaceae bacterium]